MNIVHVNLDTRSYDILVSPGLLRSAGELIADARVKGKAAIISDTNVAPLYLSALQSALTESGYKSTSHIIPAGEASKSLSQVEETCRDMTRAGHDRSSFVIALGGGVVGDLAGFVASVFYRGIPFVQIPTTIVAQVDSAVGGKTGVNISEGKNLVGAFHQPRLVIVDPDTLHSLPGREFREGFAEVIKHACIRDEPMLADLEALDPLNQSVAPDLIARNIAIKARVVEEDEQERSGTRALLNFGHTIGHGIEASLPYGEMLHGEAISLGIRAAIQLSQDHAGLSRADGNRVLDLLAHFQLPLILPERVSPETVLEKMGRDKKFSGGRPTFILLTELGHGITHDQIPDEAIMPSITNLRTPLS